MEFVLFIQLSPMNEFKLFCYTSEVDGPLEQLLLLACPLFLTQICRITFCLPTHTGYLLHLPTSSVCFSHLRTHRISEPEVEPTQDQMLKTISPVYAAHLQADLEVERNWPQCLHQTLFTSALNSDLTQACIH